MYEWRKIWANVLPNEGRSPKAGHRLATEGMPFPWRCNRGTTSTDLDVAWGTSGNIIKNTRTRSTKFQSTVVSGMLLLRTPPMILGRPVFDLGAPKLRVVGRKISNWWANLETLWLGIDDSLFGFRVYPARALLGIMSHSRWMRRFDFDVEAAVRMVWSGIRPINIDAPVRYFSPEQGGVSHFNYVRDNALLTWMHMRLFASFFVRLPWLAWRRLSQARRIQEGR